MSVLGSMPDLYTSGNGVMHGRTHCGRAYGFRRATPEEARRAMNGTPGYYLCRRCAPTELFRTPVVVDPDGPLPKDQAVSRSAAQDADLLTLEKIAALRALEHEATGGPWIQGRSAIPPSNRYCDRFAFQIWSSSVDPDTISPFVADCLSGRWPGPKKPQETAPVLIDAEFIVAIRNAAPALLAAAELGLLAAEMADVLDDMPHDEANCRRNYLTGIPCDCGKDAILRKYEALVTAQKRDNA